MKIDLQKDRLQVFDPDFMKNLVQDQDPIKDEPALNERRLIRVSDPVGQQGHPIGVPFGQDPEDHVYDRNRAELADVSRPRDLGNEGDGPKVEAAKVDRAHEEFLENGHDLGFDHAPEGLEEENREAVRARRRGGIHTLDSLPDLLFREGGRQGGIVFVRD